MKYLKHALIIGFAMFSMFFGSGNLVFPISVGRDAGLFIAPATIGLLLTGVIMPFIGLYGVWLYNGRHEAFFDRLGPYGSFGIVFVCMMLMGPFAVIPRCITVAHGGLEPLFPGLSLPMFSVIMSAGIFALTFDRHRIIPILGGILTPLLLISLAMIIGFGATSGSEPIAQTTPAKQVFTNSFSIGYYMMDLVAAFFFASEICRHSYTLSEKLKVSPTALTALSMMIGMGILAAIYVAFVYLGTIFAPQLADFPTEQGLSIIAAETLGKYGQGVVAVAVLMACLTTATVLASIFTDFVHQRIGRHKGNRHVWILGALILSCFVSTYEFKGIAAFLSPILNVLYPGLIAYTFLMIGLKWMKSQNSPPKRVKVS
ncbi:MAG: branched-chain amino acid transport system II carrier protein [Alphaproteobacteria bacterium]